MHNRPKFKHKKIWSWLFLSVLLLFAVCLVLTRHFIQDSHKFITKEYDSVFLSMFPIDNFTEESFHYWRGQTLVKSDVVLPNIDVISAYMKVISKSGNTITNAYIGIRPDKTNLADLVGITRTYNNVHYHIILSYPSIDYWRELPEEDFRETIMLYKKTAETLIQESNTTVYLFSKEWLLCNPKHYEDTFLVNSDISLSMQLYCDRNHGYNLTTENFEENFDEFTTLLERERKQPVTYPDLSGTEIVFFGDSVIGNYTDNTSIPSIVHILSNAEVYNLGYGGNTATHIDNGITLTGIVEAFIHQDLSGIPTDKQIYSGMTSYLERESTIDPTYFVINYGLNDYFVRMPIENKDPYDIYSFKGALRTAIHSLQETYPHSKIILMTPNYTAFRKPPKGMTESTDPFLSYVKAVSDIGTEMDIIVLDNYHALGINESNYSKYLSDLVHPNEASRFRIAQMLCQLMKK